MHKFIRFRLIDDPDPLVFSIDSITQYETAPNGVLFVSIEGYEMSQAVFPGDKAMVLAALTALTRDCVCRAVPFPEAVTAK